MRNLLRWFVPLFVLLVITAGVAYAGTVRSPLKDTACEITAGGACGSPFGVQVEGSAHPITGACSAALVGFVGWDLSGVTSTIETAQLTMTTFNVLGAPATPVEIQLFAPTTHDWTENGATTSPGSSGATLATTSVVLTNGTTPQTIVFGGVTNPADATTLGTHFNGLKSPGPATIGVRIASGTCGAVSVFVAFNDRENFAGQGNPGDTEPDLLLFDPTAISLSFMDAQNPNQGLYTAALIAVAILFCLTITTVYFGLPARLKQKRAD